MGSPRLLAGKYGCGPNRAAGPGLKLMKLDIAPSVVMYATGLAWTVVDISFVAVVVLTYGFKLRQSLFTARTYKVASHLEEFNLFTLEFTRGFPVGAPHSSSCWKRPGGCKTVQTARVSVSLHVSEHSELV